MKKKKKKVVAPIVDEAEASNAPAEAESASAAQADKASLRVQQPEDDGAGTSGAATPAGDVGLGEGDGAELFADMKKKKKKKKEIPADFDLATSDLPTASAEGLDKKKKSKKVASDFMRELDDMDAARAEDADASAAAAAGDADEDGAGEDGVQFGDADGGEDDDADEVDLWVKEGRVATYPELLKRFFTHLHAHNPELAGEKRRYTIVPPQVAREGSKKTMFANISDICRRMHRQPEHVIHFIYSELGTQGSIDGSGRLIMKGKFTQKQMETVLKKYIVEYVTCKICKSSDTLLGKENRLFFITCESCGSRRSVSSIKAGFQAQVGRRIKTG